MNPCPWNADQTYWCAAFIVQFASGAIAAGCHHNGCQGNGWPELRELGEPGWQERRRSSGRNGQKPAGNGQDRGEQHEPERPRFEPTPILIPLKTVISEQVEWLWPGYLPRGKVGMLDGDPGEGKSTTVLDLAARISTGRPMPDGTSVVAGGVVILSAEDGLADTIRPRLEAAGADMANIIALAGVKTENGERLPELPIDVAMLEDAIKRVEAHLVIVDPLMAYLGSDTNAHRDQDIRRALAPLANLADRRRCAVICVRHLNKGSGSNAIHRGGGSIGIIGAARAGLSIARDPDDEQRRVFVVTKLNVGVPGPALGFRLIGAANDAATIEWLGIVSHTATSILAAPREGEERSVLDEAKEWLADYLLASARPAKDVKKGARAAGISERTLDRAKAALGVKARKQLVSGEWVWERPRR